MPDFSAVWGIPQPWQMQPLRQGPSNLTRMVEAGQDRYVLRAYDVDRPLARIRYEIAVLVALHHQPLPFQIPVPLATTADEFYYDEAGTIFTLSPLLPGGHPQPEQHAFAAGAALAQLHRALAKIAISGTAPPPFLDFAGWAGTNDPFALLHQLPLTAPDKTQLSQMIDTVQTQAAVLYQRLPQQITHRDYDAPNVLVNGDTVTGVLDFEFSGPDLRVADFAFALSQWLPLESAAVWAGIESFTRGYAFVQALTPEEIEAVPLLFRLRALTTLADRLGRFQRGFTREAALIHRVRGTLAVDDWVSANEQSLTAILAGR